VARADISLKEMLIGVGLPATPPISHEERNWNSGTTAALSVAYVAVSIQILFSAVLVGWRLWRAIQHAS
jgi:hypothetical protein